MAIIYLDVDDEITSAAARIRRAEEVRLALVLPAGSRLATSRINFRLLAREAHDHSRSIAIVAPEPATRALAASAGIPVYGSVVEYEAATAQAVEGPAPATPATSAPATGSTTAGERDGRAGTDGEATVIVPPVGGLGHPPASALPAPGRLAADDGTIVIPPPAARQAGPPAARHAGPPAADASRAPAPPEPARARPAGLAPPALPVVRLGRPSWIAGRTALAVAAALAALTLLVGGVAGYVLLPSATIVVAPREAVAGPLELTIRAEPGATTDPAAAIVAAERPTFELAAAGTHPATGKRTVTVKAKGEVTFINKDPTDTNGIPAGSVVSTDGGVGFVTAAAITIPRAQIVGLTIIPGRRDVAVEAERGGPAGNVPPNAIRNVPRGEDPTLTEVFNAEPTSGGSRRDFIRISQADVDAAKGHLAARLDARLTEVLADPASAPDGTTIYAATGSRTEPTFTPDPAGLVGQEVESFELAASAVGSATAVDNDAVRSVAETRLLETIQPPYRLVEGSVVVDLGPGTPDGEAVTFTATGHATRIRDVDAEVLRELVKGRPVEEAERLLAEFGRAEVAVWPDWVTTIPTIDFRLDLSVALPPGDPGPGPTPEADATPEPSPADPSAEPTATPP